MFTLWQGLLIGSLLCVLLAWWLFAGPGMYWGMRLLRRCPGCYEPQDSYCLCRPDLDQRVECDDGTEHFLAAPPDEGPVEVVFEPEGDWEFTAWEDLTDEEREEIG